MEVYVVDKLKSDQYGTTEMVGIYASQEVAQADADKINKSGGWAMVKPYPVLTASVVKSASQKTSALLDDACESWLG